MVTYISFCLGFLHCCFLLKSDKINIVSIFIKYKLQTILENVHIDIKIMGSSTVSFPYHIMVLVSLFFQLRSYKPIFFLNFSQANSLVLFSFDMDKLEYSKLCHLFFILFRLLAPLDMHEVTGQQMDILLCVNS